MKHLFLILAILIASVNLMIAQTKISTTIILVRHAEKATNDPQDPDLSAAGFERAGALAALLTDVKIDAIFSTDFKRTRQTVDLIATQRGLDIQNYDSRGQQLEDFAKQLQGMRGKTILVSGHSNTTPDLVNILLGGSRYQHLPDSEYGKIWFVTLQAEEQKEALLLNY